ncbi:unnamed protein product [Ilex paraguariensis]|uniref:Uncharacterized protein n=1 Tax=Ilex paraguariensis TaxID=185542 RepID=A0ABC8TX19_9AQUA
MVTKSTHDTLSPSLIGAVIRRRQWKAVFSSSPVQTTHRHNQQLLNLALELSSPDTQTFDFGFNTGGEKSTVKPQAPIKLEAFILFLSDHRERAKHYYEQQKKIVDELRASEQNGEGDGVFCWFCASSTVSAWASGSLVFPLFPLDAIQGKAATSSGTTPLGEEGLSFLGDPLCLSSYLWTLLFTFPDAFKSDDAPSAGYYWVAPLPLLPFISWFISAEVFLVGLDLPLPARGQLGALFWHAPGDVSTLDPQLVFSRFSSFGLLMGPPPSMKISSPLSSCLVGLQPLAWVWKHVVELYNICHSKMEEIVPKGIMLGVLGCNGFLCCWGGLKATYF